MREEIDRLALRLRPFYSRFLEGAGKNTILLTGHSHQAWPDVSREAQLEAWDDAAKFADKKWERVLGEILPLFRRNVARRIGSTRPDDIATGTNTHELVSRLAGCFPSDAKIVTTDQEFHSLRRQLARSEEEGLRVIRVPVEDPDAPFGARFSRVLQRERPDWVALSAVVFSTGRVFDDLQVVLQTAASLEIPVLVDAYHAFNIVPLDVDRWPGQVFVTGGGYKYAEHGEGACWMLLPKDSAAFRPKNTGWFADFKSLESDAPGVEYGPGGQRFWGSTFDPTAFYRAVRVMAWMDEQGLDVPVLRAQSLRQTDLILELYDRLGPSRGLDLASPRSHASRGGFLAFRCADARGWCEKLEKRGIRTDARPPYLRLGPAPYTTSVEIQGALETIADLTG